MHEATVVVSFGEVITLSVISNKQGRGNIVSAIVNVVDRGFISSTA